MPLYNSKFSTKQTLINLMANIVSFSANIAISFILTPFLINTLGKETFGFYPTAIAIVSYLSVLSNALNSMASRFVTVSLVQNRNNDANMYFTSTLTANLILSMILLLPMIIIVALLEKFMDVPVNSMRSIKLLFALIFFSALLNISASFLGIATFAKNRIDLRSFREFVTAVVKLVLFFVLYYYFKPSIVYVGIVAVIVSSVNIAFQTAYTKILLPEIRLSLSFISLQHTKEILYSSCWNTVNSFGNILLAGMSLILANLFYGAEASGTYSIVHTVPQFICGIIVMLSGVFYPVITCRYAEKNKSGLVKEIKIAQTLIGLTTCTVISVFSALGTEFFYLWTPGENAGYLSRLSFFTIMPHYIIAVMWSLTNLNIAMNRVKVPALYTLLSGVANVVIALVAYKILPFGLITLPIISSLLQIIWVGVFIPLYACRNLDIKWHTFYPPLIESLIYSVLVSFVVIATKDFFSLNSWIKLISFGGIISLLTMSCALAFHINTLKKWSSFMPLKN